MTQSGRHGRNIAQCAMALKETGGLEPTYKVILSKCPAAALHPETQRPVGKKRVYDVSRDLGYDENPAKP